MPRTVLVGAVLAAFSFPDGTARAATPRALEPEKATRAPSLAGKGDAVRLALRVRAARRVAKGSWVVRLRLAGSRSPRGSLTVASSRVRALRRRGTARVRVAWKVPLSWVGQRPRLLLCAEPRRSRGSPPARACRVAGRSLLTGTTSHERIDAATRAKLLRRSTAVLYGLYALSGDRRLPKSFRSRSRLLDERAPVMEAASRFATLPRAGRAKAKGFFLPPSARGSAWRTTKKARATDAGVAAANPQPNCRGFELLSEPGWRSIVSSDGKARFWWNVEARGAAAFEQGARRLAASFPTAWRKLSAAFGEPQSDAGEACYHGPDGRLDVYMAQTGYGQLATTMPYPAGGRFCTDRPAFILARPSISRWALAHELMHAVQFAHRYKSCDDMGWWDEGGANWAADFVHPGDQDEHAYDSALDFGSSTYDFQTGTASWSGGAYGLYQSSYSSWPFWYYLVRSRGLGVMNQIFANLRTADAYAAVSNALPGGLRGTLPRWSVQAWNRTPIGRPGFPAASFAAWDAWPRQGATPSDTARLDGAHEKTDKLVVSTTSGLLQPSQKIAHRVFLPDPDVKELRFTNALATRRDIDVQAMLRMRDGTWKLENWTGRKEITICRDSRKVDGLVVLTTHVGERPTTSFADPRNVRGNMSHKLRLRDRCEGFPAKWTGRGSGQFVRDGLTTTWDATWSFLKYDEGADYAGYGTLNPASTGTITWSVTGRSTVNGCDVQGSGTAYLNGDMSTQQYDFAGGQAYYATIGGAYKSGGYTQRCTGPPPSEDFIADSPIKHAICRPEGPYSRQSTLSGQRVYTEDYFGQKFPARCSWSMSAG